MGDSERHNVCDARLGRQELKDFKNILECEAANIHHGEAQSD